jgi:hypothetical protein
MLIVDTDKSGYVDYTGLNFYNYWIEFLVAAMNKDKLCTS